MRFGRLRKFFAGDDQRRAVRREEELLSGVASEGLVDRRFRDEMLELARRRRGVLLGRHVADPSVELRFDVASLPGVAHMAILGSTGSGKTRTVDAMVAAMLEACARDPSAPRPWMIDHKGDAADAALGYAAEIAMRLLPHARERFLDSLVVIDPFSREALVPLQVLSRNGNAAVDDETAAYEVSTLFERVVGADLGVRQDALVFNLMLLGRASDLSLVDLWRLLHDPAELAAVAARCPHRDVRQFFATGIRLQAGSLAGVQARFTRLLRTPSLKRMFSAPSCLDFRWLLRDKIVIADFSKYELGAEDQARFLGGLFTVKMTRAIFDRPPEEAERKIVVFADEWQEGLAGGREMVEQYDRVLAMSRSKGCAFVLISQSLASVAKAGASLPKSVATNCAVQMLFRASIEDARQMTHLLPVTGRRPRPAPLPWEARRESPFLPRGEELNALVEEVANLPIRSCYVWTRGAPYKAQLVKTTDVPDPDPGFVPTDVARRVRLGAAAMPVEDLEAHRIAAERPATDVEPLGGTPLLNAPRRRPGG